MSFLSEGKEVEKRFATLVLTSVIPATQEQDINEHWDIEGVYKGERKKFDVKGLKHQNRHDIFLDENFHWIETVNVLGNVGWLYGKADYFAFEIFDYWIIIDKKVLQDFTEDKIKGREVGKKKDPYVPYRRDGREDIVIKVKTLDLFYIAAEIIKK